MFCKTDIVLQNRHCFAKQTSFCKTDIVLQNTQCFAKQTSFCKTDIVLQNRHCFAKQRISQTVYISCDLFDMRDIDIERHHRRRRSDFKKLRLPKSLQIFTGVPVNFKQVCTGVPTISMNCLWSKLVSQSSNGDPARSRDPNIFHSDLLREWLDKEI